MTPIPDTPPTVLSVQSHVAFGHVGNDAAVFGLQRLGVEAVAVHTCQLSNHTGYPGVRGRVFEAAEIVEVLEGLAARGVLETLSGLLSGWLGKAAIAEAILDTLTRARSVTNGRRVLYVCDPVMGDDTASGEGRLYAAGDIPALIRERLLPAADVLTPNRFELALLSDMPVTTAAEAAAAARAVMTRGPEMVLVTSLPLPDPARAGCLAVTAAAETVIETPRLAMPHPVNGGGDLLAALLLGHLVQGREREEAARRAVHGLFAVLEMTQALGQRELALIAAQDRLTGQLP